MTSQLEANHSSICNLNKMRKTEKGLFIAVFANMFLDYFNEGLNMT